MSMASATLCTCCGVATPCSCPDTPPPPLYGLVRISGFSGTYTIYSPWVQFSEGFLSTTYWRRRFRYTFTFYNSSDCSCPRCAIDTNQPAYGGRVPVLIKEYAEVEHLASVTGSVGFGGTRPPEGETYAGWRACSIGWRLDCDQLLVSQDNQEGWPENVPFGQFFFATVTPTTTGTVSNEAVADYGASILPLWSSLTIERNVATCRLCATAPYAYEEDETRYVRYSTNEFCEVAHSVWDSSIWDLADSAPASDEFGGVNFVAYGSGTDPTSANLSNLVIPPINGIGNSVTNGYAKVTGFSASPCCAGPGDYIVPLYVLDPFNAFISLIDPTGTDTPPEDFPDTVSVTSGPCAIPCTDSIRDFTTCASSYAVTITGCTGPAAVLNGTRIITRDSSSSYILSGGPGAVSITLGASGADPDKLRLDVFIGADPRLIFNVTRDCANCPTDYTWTLVSSTSGGGTASISIA